MQGRKEKIFNDLYTHFFRGNKGKQKKTNNKVKYAKTRPHTLTVDVVHGGLDVRVGVEVDDERGDDLVAVLAHQRRQLRLDRVRDLVLARKGLVQVQARNRRANHVKDVRADLGLGVGELVKGAGDLVLHHLVLHRHHHLHEDVVLGLGVAGDVQVLDAQRDLVHEVLHRTQETVAARGKHALEATAVLHHARLHLRHESETAAVHSLSSTCFLLTDNNNNNKKKN